MLTTAASVFSCVASRNKRGERHSKAGWSYLSYPKQLTASISAAYREYL